MGYEAATGNENADKIDGFQNYVKNGLTCQPRSNAGKLPGLWGEISGPMNSWNEQASRQIAEILDGPGQFKKVTSKNGISFLEKRLRDGRGIRLNMDGTFKGFIE